MRYILNTYLLLLLFVDQVSSFSDIKFLVFVWNIIFLLPSQLCRKNKNICQVYTFINQEGLVMTRLKELGQSGNYML